MPRTLRPLLVLLVLALAALGLAACGGDDGDEASSSDDPVKLLDETFKGEKDVKSGKLDLTLKLDVKGAEGVNGPIDVRLSGPFQSVGDKKLPKFDLDLGFEGAGQSIKAGATSTGDKGFLNFNGQDYAVTDEVFQQFKKGYEDAQKQSGNQNQNPSLQTLGLNPRNWLTNPKNEGEADVGGDAAIKITGGVDVAKLLTDVDTALGKAQSLGLQGAGELPSKLTDEQKRQIQQAVKDLKVEIYTGKDDKILRRMVVALGIDDPESDQSANLRFDLSISGLNEDQEIKAPSNPKPFEELADELGGLGLGGLGGSGSGSGGSGSGSGSGGSGSGSGSGGSGGSGSGGASNEKLEEYTKCINDAGNDLDKARECSDLLTP